MPYRSVNPATGEILKTFDGHTDDEIEAALATAHAVYRSDWSTGSRARRLDVLARLADRIDEQAEELAVLATKEMGKRISETRHEVSLIAEIARCMPRVPRAFSLPSRFGAEAARPGSSTIPSG